MPRFIQDQDHKAGQQQQKENNTNDENNNNTSMQGKSTTTRTRKRRNTIRGKEQMQISALAQWKTHLLMRNQDLRISVSFMVGAAILLTNIMT